MDYNTKACKGALKNVSTLSQATRSSGRGTTTGSGRGIGSIRERKWFTSNKKQEQGSTSYMIVEV